MSTTTNPRKNLSCDETTQFPALWMLSIPQASLLTNVGSTKIYAEIKLGRLACVKVGTRTLIKAADLLLWQKSLPCRSRTGSGGAN